MDASAAWYGPAVAAAIAIIGAVASYVRSTTRSDEQIKAVRHELDAVKSELAIDTSEVRDGFDKMTRMVGESLQAIRQKVSDTEIWNRDNFVRKADFVETVASFNRNVDGIRALVETTHRETNSKLDRMRESLEQKIDKVKET